ncbi:FG-GAP-like repeat-containing protein [Paenarthrobacter sp. NPDC089322]|uniref:FG-GAP-like repeat-containing protein n=1 Tax=Paenarthrobacter sp. NPDC089322 TaxID=3155065 RepID=UPI003431ABE3
MGLTGNILVRRSAAWAVALALTAGISALAVPADADTTDDVYVHGNPVVGAVLSVEGAPAHFANCGGNGEPGYSIQWLRDGDPVDARPPYSPYLFPLESSDLGSRISAVATGSATNCAGLEVVTDPSEIIQKEPMRAAGFTGRDTFELLGRGHGGTLVMYLGEDGRQGWKETRQVGPGWEVFTRIIAAGDFTTDGITDLMATDDSGTLYRFQGTGDGGFYTFRHAVGWGWSGIDKVAGPGDFDGDGLNDLLGSTAGGDLYLFPSHPWGGWRPSVKIGQGWDVMDLLIGPGDWDGDGNVDVLAKDKAGRLYLYGGNGHGGWATSRQIGQGWNALTMVGIAGDFNRDGFNDVHGVNAAGDLLMYYGDGHGGWKGVETVGWGWNIFNGLY